jgi:hypothetical protein
VRFDARGITGFIRFTEVGDDVMIEANLQGLRGEVTSASGVDTSTHHDLCGMQ